MDEEKIDVAYIADLARLELTSEEIDRFSMQLNDIIGFVKKLEKLDTKDIEPTAHASPVYDVMREDQSREGFGAKTALRNAPSISSNQFKVTRVVE